MDIQEEKFIEVITAYFRKITTELQNLEFQGNEIGLDIFIIEFLGKEKEVAMKNLAAYLNVIPSTATKRVNRLVEFGLVRRGNSEKDRRIVELYLTTNGRDLFNLFLLKRLAAMKEIKRHFSKEELDTYISIISRLVELGHNYSFSKL